MSRRKISQREARAAIAERDALRTERRRREAPFAQDYPGGIDLAGAMGLNDSWWWVLKTAKKLGCYIVAVPQDDNKVRFFGVKP